MPLERFELDAVREPDGFTFLMRTIKTMQTVCVFVMDEALQGDDLMSSEDGLRAQFETDRAVLRPSRAKNTNVGELRKMI